MDVTRLSDRTRELRAFLCVLTLICTGGLAVASPYDLDPSFGDGGKLLIGPGSAGAPSQLLLQQDGRFFVFSGSIWRFNPDGTLDPTFGNGSGTVSQSQICNSLVVVGYICYVQSIATQPDDKILVALLRGIYGYGLAFGVERLLADGTPDQAFGAGGLSFLSTVAPTTSDYGGIILFQNNCHN